MKNQFTIGSGLLNAVDVSLDGDLFVIAGPCIIETQQICLEIAKRLCDISQNTGVKTIFKASFDKANRSSIDSFRGPGLEKGLEILAKVREQTKLPIITDIHETQQAEPAAMVVDCLQVPAFLCRQTDLLCACAETGKPINRVKISKSFQKMADLYLIQSIIYRQTHLLKI